MQRASLVFEPTHPVHLGQTFAPLARGGADPLYRQVALPRGVTAHWLTARLEGSGLFDGGETQSGAGILARFRRLAQHVVPSGDRLRSPIEVTAWTDMQGKAGADALDRFLAAAPAWAGGNDHWSSFYDSPAWELLPTRFKEARAQNPGLRLPSTGLLTQHLVLAITEQRVTTGEAYRSIRTILGAHGTPAPATGEPDQPPGLIIFPSAQTLATVPSWDWHRAGYDRARSDTIMTALHRAQTLEATASVSGISGLARALAALPGIGPWTIAETLQRYCGHPDAVSVGDYHLAHHVTYAFEGKRGDDTRMLTLLAPYAGHRQRVISLIRAAGIQEPRRAPKLSPQDHRHH